MRDPERTTCRCLSTSIRPQRYQVLDLVQLGIDDLQPKVGRLVCDSERQGSNQIAPAGIIDGPFLATLRAVSLKRRRSSDGKGSSEASR